MDEGTFEEARNAPVYGALTQVGAPADTRRVVPGLEYNLEKQNKLIDEFYAPRVKMYEDLTAKIAARRAGPPLSERLAQLSAALAQPTKYSGPGNMFGAISSVYADQQKAQREERLANEDLATKYQMALMGEQESRFDKQMTARQKLDEMRMRYLAKAGPGKPMRALVNAIGEALHPTLGYVLPKIGNEDGQVPMAAIQLMLSRNDPSVDAIFDEKYNAPGYAQHVRATYGGDNIAPDAVGSDYETEE